jgi:hypothetical protein
MRAVLIRSPTYTASDQENPTRAWPHIHWGHWEERGRKLKMHHL